MMPEADSKPTPEDLDLIDDGIQDEAKSDEELWAEMDREEAGESEADDRDVAASSTDDDDKAKSGDEEEEPDTEVASAPDDLWAGASENQRAAYEAAQKEIEKLQQSDRSQRGRLGALQRQLNELHAASQAAAKPAADDEEQEADPQYLESDEWKKFHNEFPEVAAPMQSLTSSLQQEVTRLRKELTAIGSDRRQEAADEQAAILDEQHENWETVVAADEFMPWLDKQPRHIREAASRNSEVIVDAEEAADVIGRFKAFRSAQGETAPKAETPPGKTGGNGTQRLSGKRKRQLETAATSRTGGPGAAHGIPEDGDPEAIWKAFDRQEERERRQRA